MQIIGYSSSDYERDNRNGIKIIGPQYSDEILSSIPGIAKELESQYILTFRTFLNNYINKHFKENGIINYDKASKLKFDYVDMEREMIMYIEHFLNINPNIHSFYLIEEPRHWIKSDCELLENMFNIINRNFKVDRYNRVIRSHGNSLEYSSDPLIFTYHPNHLLSQPGRIEFFSYLSIIGFGCYLKIEIDNRLDILQRLIYIENVAKKHKKKSAAYFLMNDYDTGTLFLKEKIFHDCFCATLCNMDYLFIFSFHESKIKSKEKYDTYYNSYIDSLKYLKTNKIENISMVEFFKKNAIEKKIIYRNDAPGNQWVDFDVNVGEECSYFVVNRFFYRINIFINHTSFKKSFAGENVSPYGIKIKYELEIIRMLFFLIFFLFLFKKLF